MKDNTYKYAWHKGWFIKGGETYGKFWWVWCARQPPQGRDPLDETLPGYCARADSWENGLEKIKAIIS